MMSYYIIDAMKVDVANAKALSYNTGEGSLETDDEIPPVQRGGGCRGPGGANQTAWIRASRPPWGRMPAVVAPCIAPRRRVPVQVRWDDTRPAAWASRSFRR
jgi:hypothetical protein